jgi:hypothetical protein
MGPNRTQRSARVPIQDAEAFLVGRLSSITKLSLYFVQHLTDGCRIMDCEVSLLA